MRRRALRRNRRWPAQWHEAGGHVLLLRRLQTLRAAAPTRQVCGSSGPLERRPCSHADLNFKM